MSRLLQVLALILVSGVVRGRVEEAEKGAYPFIASLQIADLGGHTCAGAILSESWVISTATCADTDDSLDHNNFMVVAGEWDISSDDGTEQAVHVEKVYRHPYFSADQSFDIALIRLASPLNLTGLATVELAADGESFQGHCTEVGWSQLAGKRKMQVGHPLYISTVYCQHNAIMGDLIDFTSFCGTNSETDKAEMCPGYLGSPMLCSSENGGEVLAGLQSATYQCGEPGVPSTYTKIAALRDWVDYVLGKYPDV